MHLNMVRPGIALYGLYPSDEVDKTKIDLRPAMSLKANVILVKMWKRTHHHTPFKQSDTSNEVKIMFLADFICASFYEKLLGDEETFILYSNKVREELNLSEEFILHVAKRMPEEVEKISRNRFLDFL